MAQNKETIIQRDIIAMLKSNFVFCWRNYMGPVFFAGGAARKNPNKGMPDIAGIIPDSNGRIFFIEVKTEKGKLSDEQTTWMLKLRDKGVIVLIARSVLDVQQEFNKIGISLF
jgi:hypothetical protein